MGWIGVDLDGTLAQYDGWKGPEHVGEPVPAILAKVRQWMAEGRIVKIFTARACKPDEVKYVRAWLQKHGLGKLEVTNVKDFGMQVLYDDRAVQVEPNTGRIVGEDDRVLAAINEQMIAAAQEEITSKSYADIQKETAMKWGARAIAAFQLAISKKDDQKQFVACMLHGEEYFHEAIEHAALVEDGGSTTRAVQAVIEPYRIAVIG